MSRRARKAADPVEQAGIPLERIAEEAAGGKQRADPEERSDPIEEQECGIGHAVLAGDGRRERWPGRG